MNAMDYAKFFIAQKIGAEANSFDGNMKLQKLLFFADMINLAQYDTPLFHDNVYAFKKGCVVETVRKRFQYDYVRLMAEVSSSDLVFDQSDMDTLTKTVMIYGKLSSDELSELCHQFSFWERQYNDSFVSDNFREKDYSIISVDMMRNEIGIIKNILDAYNESCDNSLNEIVINGVKFYYDSNIEITDEAVKCLKDFSKFAEDDAYSFYYDNGELVIY